jgi:hypothetical protein
MGKLQAINGKADFIYKQCLRLSTHTVVVGDTTRLVPPPPHQPALLGGGYSMSLATLIVLSAIDDTGEGRPNINNDIAYCGFLLFDVVPPPLT